jgi:hypothetical protein
VAAQAGKSDAKRNAMFVIDQKVIRLGARDGPNLESHAPQPSRDATFGEIVFV